MVRTLSIVAFKPREKLLGEPSIFRLWMFVDEEYDDQVGKQETFSFLEIIFLKLSKTFELE